MYTLNSVFLFISALTPVYFTESCSNVKSFISAQQYSSIFTNNQLSTVFTNTDGLDCVVSCYQSGSGVKFSIYDPTERKCVCLRSTLDIVDSPQDGILVHVADVPQPGKFGHRGVIRLDDIAYILIKM